MNTHPTLQLAPTRTKNRKKKKSLLPRLSPLLSMQRKRGKRKVIARKKRKVDREIKQLVALSGTARFSNLPIPTPDHATGNGGAAVDQR
jgi:hypothetical protein